MGFGAMLTGGGSGKAKTNNTTGNIKLGNTAGALFSSDDNDNVAIGTSSLNSTTTDSNNNVAIGTNALTAVTTGDGNIGIGKDAMSISSGSNNVCIGTEAGKIIAVSDNVAIGSNALKGNSNGTANVVIGKGAYETGASSSIVAIGTAAGANHAATNPAGSHSSIIIGNNAMLESTTTIMAGNVIIGASAASAEPSYFHVDVDIADEHGQLSIGTNGASGVAASAVQIIKRKSIVNTMTGSYTNANQDNKAAFAKLFTIPALSFISRVIVRVKRLGAGTHKYNVSLGTAADEASGDTVAGQVELLGAGSGSTAVTRTQGTQDGHADIDASSGATDETLYISEISPGVDDSVGWCGALRYVYLCHAGTGNATSDPGTDPIIEVIVEYY